MVDRSGTGQQEPEKTLPASEERRDGAPDGVQEPEVEVQLRQVVKVGFSVAVIFTGLLGLLSWRMAQQAAETADWVAHTDEVSTTLEFALRHLLDVETGARGFGLRGAPDFLEPYEEGRHEVGHDLERLRRLVRDNPDQEQRWGTLSQQANGIIEACTALVAARRQTETPPLVPQLERGKHIMDAARVTVARMEAEEHRLLEQRTQHARATRHLTSSAIVSGSIIEVIFLFIAGITVNRQIGASARARAQVKVLYADLEQRVKRRTAELQSEVAARMGTEVRLRASEELFRLLLDGIKDYAVYMLDPEGRVVSWNAGAARIKGYEAEEIIGKHVSCFYTDTDRDRNHPQASLQKAVVKGRFEEQAWRVRKDGSKFWANAVLTPLYQADGALRGYSRVVRDITERKRTEEALCEKEHLLSESQRIAHIGSWTYELKNPADRFLWSDEMYRLYGVSPDTFIPTTEAVLKWIVPEDRSASHQWVAACAAGEEPGDFEVRVILPNGTERILSRRGELQYDSEHKPIRMVGTLQDVTERRRAENALRESEERFQTMVNGIPQLAWMAAPDGFIFWYNQRWYDYTGTTFEQMQGWGWQSVHDADILPQVMGRWGTALAEGEPFDMEFPLRGADGLFHAFLTLVMPLKDPLGRVVRWFGTHTDISERKGAEERLAAQAEELLRSQVALEGQTFMLQSVLNSMIEGLVAADEQGKFILWNAAAEKILGLGAPNLPPKEWAAHYGVYLPDKVTPVPPGQTPLERAIRGESSSSELFVRTPGLNREVWLEMNGAPLRNKDGVLRGGVAAFRDVTRGKADELEILQLNEDLEGRIARRTAQLEAANHELEAFSYSVSHDLRTPLRHIGGFSRILMTEFGPVMPAGAQDFLQRIEDAVHRMGLLIDALLKMAVLRRQSLKLRHSELNPIVDEVIAILQPECEGRDVEWRIAPLPALECDPVLMRQVLQNLLGNALKYSRGKTRAVIEVDSIQRPGKPAIILVRDNGAGFNIKYAEKLFGLFQRLHTESEFEGTGVGLATVHRIIQKHGGVIWAEAEVDHGATFYFALQMTEQIGTSTTAGISAELK